MDAASKISVIRDTGTVVDDTRYREKTSQFRLPNRLGLPLIRVIRRETLGEKDERNAFPSELHRRTVRSDMITYVHAPRRTPVPVPVSQEPMSSFGKQEREIKITVNNYRENTG